MKLLTLRSEDTTRPAVMVGSDVLDLVGAADVIDLARQVPPGVRGILASGAPGLQLIGQIIARASEEPAASALKAAGALFAFAQAKLAPVVPDPAMFISVGANSRGHLHEMNDPPPPTPDSFFKVRSALAASGDVIRPPAEYADMLDWEGEMCVVIGARCHRIEAGDAEHYIAGYTLTNDVSARNNVREFITATGRGPSIVAYRTLTQLKNFPGFCPIGPVIATKDEFPAVWDYHMETLVNGEVVQTSNKADLVFTPADILAYYSRFYVFEPGDMFSLGSPPGVGMAMKPQRFLKPGDLVEVRVPEIGVLSCPIGAPADA